MSLVFLKSEKFPLETGVIGVAFSIYCNFDSSILFPLVLGLFIGSMSAIKELLSSIISSILLS